jgi:hypothetical protein
VGCGRAEGGWGEHGAGGLLRVVTKDGSKTGGQGADGGREGCGGWGEEQAGELRGGLRRNGGKRERVGCERGG